jgi:hypothetical protein
MPERISQGKSREGGLRQGGPSAAWHERIRDPSLTVLLVLELCLVFIAAAARGMAIARPIARTLVLAVGDRRHIVASTGCGCGDPAGPGRRSGEPLFREEWSPLAGGCSTAAAMV